MKNVFLFLISFLSLNVYGQVYLNPHIVLCPQNFFRSKNLSLDKIEITSNETILYLTHAVLTEWVNIRKDVCIQSLDGTEKYSFIKAEGIPVAPEKYYFDKTTPYLKFKLFFEKIPSTLKQFDLIECPESDNCFNLYDISTKFSFEKEKEYSEYIEKYLPFTLWKHFYISPKGESNGNSFDDIFYSELVKMNNVFNLNEFYQEPTKELNFRARIISFLYNGNLLTVTFDSKKSLYNLKFVRIDFKTENEATLFLKGFSEYFHMKKVTDTSYAHSRFVGRQISQEGKSIFIITLV